MASTCALCASGSRARQRSSTAACAPAAHANAHAPSWACINRSASAPALRRGSRACMPRERGRTVWRMRSSASDSSLVGSSMSEKSTGAAVSAAAAGSATAEVRSERCDTAASARAAGTEARSGGGSRSAAAAVGVRAVMLRPAKPQRPAGGSAACGARRPLHTACTEAAVGCARRMSRRSALARMAQPPCVPPHCMRAGEARAVRCDPPAGFSQLQRQHCTTAPEPRHCARLPCSAAW